MTDRFAAHTRLQSRLQSRVVAAWKVDFSLLSPGAPLAIGTLPGGGTYTQAAGSGQTEETVQTSASTVARWAFVANLPRVGLLADGGIGLVLEPPRTNVLLRSDAVDNAQWIKNPVITINPNATASPTGASDAETATGSDGNGYVSNQNTISAAVQTYYGTAWLKADVSRTLGIWVVDASDGAPGIARDWVIGTTWGRYGHTCDFDATTPSVGLFLGVNTRFAAGGTYGLWGAQAEKGRYATNWIPTAAATASRAGFRVTVPLSRYVRGGAFRAVLTTVPHGASTDYNNDSTTVRLWTIDAGTYAEFNTSTRVLTVSVNGVARVAGVPLWWLKGHRVQWSWEVGNGALRVRYRYSTDQGATWTLPFDPFGGTVYSDSAISTASATIDLYSDSGSSKWWGTGIVSEEAILTAPAWALQALPTDVASVKAWFRSDGHYTLSGSLVSAWGEQSSNQHNTTQVTSSAQPTYNASGLDGKPYLSFDGGDSLSFPSSIDVAARDWLIAFVSQATVTGGSTTLFSSYDGAANAMHIAQSGWSTPGKTSWYDTTWKEPANETLSPVLHVWDLRAGVNAAGYFRNGTLTGGNATYSQRNLNNASGTRIGAGYNGLSGFTGRIYDFVLLRSHSTADRDAIHSFFRTKYPTLAVA